MATADLRRRRRLRAVVGPVLVPVVAAVVVFAAMQRPGPISARAADVPDAAGPGAPVLAVDAVSVFHFDTLDELVDASDLVVVGQVIATEPGRLVGDPRSGGVVSRLVTLHVEDVLWDPQTQRCRHGGDRGGRLVARRHRHAVNGLAASRSGYRGVWFLDRIDGETMTYLVTNEQGRYLDAGSGSAGADRTDPLIEQLERRSVDELARSVLAVHPDGPTR